MSYCRFSTNDFSSDIYAYQCEEGIHIDVAANRVSLAEPLPEPVAPPGRDATTDQLTAWMGRQQQVGNIVSRSETTPIAHPTAGASRTFPAAGEALTYLEGLDRDGFNVPRQALDALTAEVNGT